MARDLTQFNLNEAVEAVRQYLQDGVEVHQELFEALGHRNRGVFGDYAARNRSLWSRLLGRLREAGMDSPEALIGSAALLASGTALTLFLASRGRRPRR